MTKQYKNVTYPTARIQLDAGMYSRQQLQDAICCIDALNAQAKASMQPKKEWVGLTDEEFKKVCWESGGDGITGGREEALRAMEALLKEKNLWDWKTYD